MTKPNKQEFLSAFAALFKDEENIVLDTYFRQLEEWSSMQALIVIAAIDEHFGVTIPEKEFRAANSVADLFEIVNQRSVNG